MDISRRNFLAAGAVTGLGAMAWLAGCAPPKSGSMLSGLQARLKGQVLVPGDPEYRIASEPTNGRYLSVKPLAVAVVADESDVAECIRWCKENGIQPVARGRGHSYAGYSTTEGLVINLSKLNAVVLDRQAGTVTTGGGALNQDLSTTLTGGPLFLPVGTCVGIGLGGLVLGGGIGFNTHWAGLTCDHLLETQMVTADGSLVSANSQSNPNLLWACKGAAGGSLGINTQFTFSLVEVPAAVVYYQFDFLGSDAAFEVFKRFDALMQAAPAGLNAVCMAEAVPKDERAQNAAIRAMVRGQHVGTEGEARDLLAPILDIAGITSQTLEPQSFWQAQSNLSTMNPQPHSFAEPNRFTRDRLPDDLLAGLVNALEDCPSQSADATGSVWLFGWVGGPVVGQVAPKDTAYFHRDVSLILRATVVWPNDAPAEVSDDLLAWSDQVMALVTPHTLNQSYQNFPNRALTDYLQNYYGENLTRLVNVKAKCDPQNLFNNAQSIPVTMP
ncbi:MAG: FAD-binding protein [Candidatus Nanopelagicales bacterium]